MRIILFIVCLIGSVLYLQAQEKFIQTSDSVKLYANVKGSGTACLYIHGGPGSGSYWLEEFMGEALEQQFTMIYLDQRGVGRSSSPEDHNYSMKRMVMDFEEVRKALGIEKWIILGHSFGGLLQMSYVTSYPASINGLIFINCTLSMNDSFGRSWLPKALELAGENASEVSRDTSESVYKRMLAIIPVLGEKGEMWKIFFKKEENSWKMNETYSRFENWNTDMNRYILEIDEYWNDFRGLSKEVVQPVLFYYGKNDCAVGPEHYKAIAFPEMLLWGSEAGHMPFIENKADVVKAINVFAEKYSF